MSRRSPHHSDTGPGGERDGSSSTTRPRRDRRSSRWDEHRRARRQELTAATIVAIRAHGAEVGMSQVAAQARTSKTVVYRHFADKNDLYLAVCDWVAAVLVGQLQSAMRDAVENPRQTLVSGIDAYLGLIEADPEVYRYVMRPPKLDRPEGEDPVSDLCTVIGDHIAEIISTELRRQDRDPAPAQTWGHALVGMVRAAGDQWLAARPDLEREALAGQLADLAWSGLSRTVTPTAASSAS
ncbi:TetR/AcrR family transcriptional regulator [Actinomycetospora aeridis]|uniref:TetR/AcrR family transcriptional regulator n=1 Tax=Actinomycetospora aeridis TaxID=3129231 RepID=A0ABU8N1W7_9PSEU